MSWLKRSAVLTALVASGLAVGAGPQAHAASVSPSPSPIPASASWLTTVNYYRAIAGLPGVTDNAAYSSGASNHSKYTAYNGLSHSEDPSKPYYTASGKAAGESSNVAAHSATSVTARRFIEMWMVGPYHAIGILRPGLKSSAFGQFSTTAADFRWKSTATLDVIRGVDWSAPAPTQPVLFPAPGKTLPLTAYGGSESPDPMVPCGSGWSAPTSAPIIALMPSPTNNVSVTLSGPSGAIPSSQLCVIHRGNTSGTAHNIINGENAVVIFARNPFVNGSYSASITSNGARTAWSFAIDSTVLDGQTPPPPSPAALPVTSALGQPANLVPIVPPIRSVDTRPTQGGPGPLAAGATGRFKIRGHKGVPGNAVAVTANITAVTPSAGGYLTVYPCSAKRPTVASVNFAAGVTTANAAFAPLSANGELCVFASAATNVVIDIAGVFASQGTGQLTSLAPKRILDTKGPAAALAAGKPVTLKVAGVGATPATGVAAVALSVTAVDPAAGGYLTVYPCGRPPTISSLSIAARVSRTNLVVSALSTSGTVCLLSSVATDVQVDIVGYFNATASLQLQSLAPIRLVDTRSTDVRLAPLGAGVRARTNSSTRIQVSGVRGITSGAAVSLNVTVVGPAANGKALVYPCGTLPNAASLVYATNATVSSAVLSKLDAKGGVCVHTTAAAHIIVDITGIWV